MVIILLGNDTVLVSADILVTLCQILIFRGSFFWKIFDIKNKQNLNNFCNDNNNNNNNNNNTFSISVYEIKYVVPKTMLISPTEKL